MLRSSSANSTITVYNTDTTAALNYTANVSASISDAISVTPSVGTVAPNGSTPLTVTAHVSGTKPNGDYNGTILINSSYPSQGQAGLAPALAVKVNYSVTDKQTQGLRVNGVRLYDTEFGSPFPYLINGTGTGNVDAVGFLRVNLQDVKTNRSIGTYNSSQFTIPAREAKSANGTYGSGSNIPIGQYKARADVMFNGTSIYNITSQVEVFERGALQSKGELSSISLNPWANVGETVKLTGIFKNTGTVPIDGTLRLDITKGGTLVTHTSSDTLQVLPGQTADLNAYFTPASAGQYTITGHVVYANKQTEDKATILNVQDTGSNMWWWILAAVIIIGIAAGGGYYYFRRRA